MPACVVRETSSGSAAGFSPAAIAVLSFERDSAIDLGLAEGPGKAERQQPREDAYQHPAEEKIANHVRNPF